MFGFMALYRRECIFAALPKTRGMEAPNAFGFKLGTITPKVRARLRSDPRVGRGPMQEACWFNFEMSSEADLRAALDWLSRAYEAARG